MINTGINLTGEANSSFPRNAGAASIEIQSMFASMANAVSAKVGLTSEASLDSKFENNFV